MQEAHAKILNLLRDRVRGLDEGVTTVRKILENPEQAHSINREYIEKHLNKLVKQLEKSEKELKSFLEYLRTETGYVSE